jgi:uncharacterized membrane protein
MAAFDPAAIYARLRTSWSFVLGVVAIAGFWITWNLLPGLPHFDDWEFGRLNLLLSIEASVGGVALLMVVERQARQHERQMRYMRDLIEAVRDALVMADRPSDAPVAPQSVAADRPEASQD